ncbi:MAG: transketolase [Bacillota bacterium]|nr:transketolase [Candidatus Fermentithermobacillaceae bacterium]
MSKLQRETGGSGAGVEHIEEMARRLRYHIIRMVGKAGSGHPGGSLSSSDIVAALYFGGVLRVDPRNPLWSERDRFVLSKGHAAPVLYAALAEMGFFPVDVLLTLRKMGSPLQGHPDCRKVAGVEVSTGSLGQGLSIAVGMALAGKLDKKDYKVWALLGDGECQEGQVWEAAMAAAHYKLDNLRIIIDHNHLQIDGPVDRVMSVGSLGDKFRAFGWEVLSVDGHDIRELLEAYRRSSEGKPLAIVAETVKGKGVKFMEGVAAWHGKVPQGEELDRALAEVTIRETEERGQ